MRRSTLVVVIAIAVLLVAGGGVGVFRAHQLRTTVSARNLALTDAGLTAQVQAQVSQTLTKVLSYDFSDPTPTEQAASALLAGDARSQYDTLLTTLKQKAPSQQLVLSAQVQSAAVKTLTASTATLLVFLDQSSQRAAEKQPSVSAAQLKVDAARIDGTWKVTGLEPL